MKTIVGWTLVVVLLASGIAAAGGSSDQTEAILTICKLHDRAEEFGGRSVRLTAVYTTDLHHVGVFKDRDCPSRYLDFKKVDQQTQDPSVDAFEDAVITNFPAYKSAAFRVQMTGVYLPATAERRRESFEVHTIESFRRLSGDWRTAN